MSNVSTEELQNLIEHFDPFKTIFFFGGHYHRVVNDWLHEIPAVEAEQILKAGDWNLWNLGTPPAKLPDSCPAWSGANISVIGSIEGFLQTTFNAAFRQTIVNIANNNKN